MNTYVSQLSRTKRGLITSLQTVVVLIGIAALFLLLWEPHIEGRNAHAMFFQVYFNDPFLAYAYVASIPFFIALFQMFNALGYVKKNKIFSLKGVKAMRIIKYCALISIGFVMLGEVFILLGTSDDRTGGFFMGFLITLGSVVAAAAASIFEKTLQKNRSVK